MAGTLAKMNVWLPGSQYAAAGSLNAVTGAIEFFVSRGVRGGEGMGGKGGRATNVCR